MQACMLHVLQELLHALQELLRVLCLYLARSCTYIDIYGGSRGIATSYIWQIFLAITLQLSIKTLRLLL
jgi:hypothetical protein